MFYIYVYIGARWWDILGCWRSGHKERKRSMEMFDFKRRFGHHGFPDNRDQYNNIGFWF